MPASRLMQNLAASGGTFREALRVRNVGVLASLLGPAWRGFVRQQAKGVAGTEVDGANPVHFDWTYERDRPDLARLHTAAKRSQWDAEKALDWSRPVDAGDPATDLMPDEFLPFSDLPQFAAASAGERTAQKRDYMAWTLSQFLHGEQGALFAAAQVTTAVQSLDGKLYGSTQVMDEGRHVEVFHRYLMTKLEKRYEINDNLYVIIDALMTDARWDVKFLGMQILVEGLALGAFGVIRKRTREPLLQDLLRLVITDEARHVHFGVLALEHLYTRELGEKELRDRQDWAFEMSLLLRNRFLLQEFYDEHYAHALPRRAWDAHVLASPMMRLFRETMFRRIVPNLKRIGLLPDRLRPHYQDIGLLVWEDGKAAPELTAEDLLEG
jgi:para-aminobenzoate N-oxygenase AurF